MAAQLTSTNGAAERALGVEPAGHQLLARAVLAGDEHPGLARGHLVDQLADVLDLGRDADDVFRLRGMRAAAAAHDGSRGGRRCGRGICDGAVDGLQQPVHVDRLGQEVLRSAAHGLHRRVDRGVGRKGYERNAGIGDLASGVRNDQVERNLPAYIRGCRLVLNGFRRKSFIFQPLAQNVSHAF